MLVIVPWKSTIQVNGYKNKRLMMITDMIKVLINTYIYIYNLINN